jgi:hypothetical protein
MAFEASNKTKSVRNLLIDRAHYDANILKKNRGVNGQTWETKKIKDFRNSEKIFYGRVDSLGNPILLGARWLKPLSLKQGGRPVSAVDFVSTAFTDLQKFFDLGAKDGRAKAVLPVYSSLAATKGYENPQKQYRDHIAMLTENFVNIYMAAGDKLKHVRDFKTFVPYFMNFAKLTGPSVPLLKTSYITSQFVSPLVSGLMIEIYDGDCSDDKVKHDMFYAQKDFQFLKDAAYLHGFVIDKHVPWRLVADLNSPMMQSYIRKVFPEPLDVETVMKIVYNDPYPNDIPILIRMMVGFYNSLASRFPSTQIGNCLVPETIYRQPVDIDVVSTQHDVGFWLRLYTTMRNAETGIDYSDTILDRIVDNATDIAKAVDNASALGYITSKFNNVEHFGGSLFYGVTRRKMADNPEIDEEDVEKTVKTSVQLSNFKTY